MPPNCEVASSAHFLASAFTSNLLKSLSKKISKPDLVCPFETTEKSVRVSSKRLVNGSTKNEKLVCQINCRISE